MPRVYHTINIGARANDRTGDATRVAMKKINQNFAMLFEGTGGELVSRAADFTAVKFTTYLVDTSAGAISAALPASPAPGDAVRFIDAFATFATNALTLTSAAKIDALDADKVITTNLATVTYTYINSAVGWIRT